MSPCLAIEGLRVAYGEQLAIDDFSLAAAKGEFLTLLGPSGCGKTTTLRCIAGFVTPASGRIRVGDQDITGLQAHKRNIGMVFQSYALFPHLTAGENVAFGLRMRHVRKDERRNRAHDALETVGLSQMADRYPGQMSGGQQQRVALARALVIEPRLLLLDEPLSNLDANLRAELRSEIRLLQSRLQITTILVTHDQQEALAVSDRIAIMNQGRIVDIGTPEELCNAPRDAFAAAFLGGRTVIPGATRDGVFEAPGLTCRGAPRDATRIVLRGQRLRLNATSGPLCVFGRVASRVYLGESFEVDVETASGPVRAIVPSETPPPRIGEPCALSAPPDGFSFICGDSSQRRI
jgi:ABC-type Fe3+/spermidine/putrescine transport system ATPase subunit